jgi:hypothetical protein
MRACIAQRARRPSEAAQALRVVLVDRVAWSGTPPAGGERMESKRITCPESGHLETIDYERTPCGIVIDACSRFDPACAVGCGGECARRLDLRDRLHVDDHSDRVLVVFANERASRPLAVAIAEALQQDGMIVELANADTFATPPPADYDAVVLGAAGHLPSSLREYIRAHRDALRAMPTALFVRDASAVAAIVKRTRWLPTRSAVFARRGLLDEWFGDPSEQAAADAAVAHQLAVALADDLPNA